MCNMSDIKNNNRTNTQLNKYFIIILLPMLISILLYTAQISILLV